VLGSSGGRALENGQNWQNEEFMKNALIEQFGGVNPIGEDGEPTEEFVKKFKVEFSEQEKVEILKNNSEVKKAKEMLNFLEVLEEDGGEEQLNFGGFEIEDFFQGEMGLVMQEADEETKAELKKLNKLVVGEDNSIKVVGVDGVEKEVNLEELGFKVEEKEDGTKVIVTPEGKQIELNELALSKGVPIVLEDDGTVELGFPKKLKKKLVENAKKMVEKVEEKVIKIEEKKAAVKKAKEALKVAQEAIKLATMTPSQVRLHKMKEKSKAKRDNFKKMIKVNKEEGPILGKQKFMMVDREKGKSKIC
jgi:hypothetical protein